MSRVDELSSLGRLDGLEDDCWQGGESHYQPQALTVDAGEVAPLEDTRVFGYTDDGAEISLSNLGANVNLGPVLKIDEEVILAEMDRIGLGQAFKDAFLLGLDMMRHPVRYASNPRETISLVKEAVLAMGIIGVGGYVGVKSLLAGTIGYSAAEAVVRETTGLNLTDQNEIMARISVALVFIGTGPAPYTLLGMIAAKLGLTKLPEKRA